MEKMKKPIATAVWIALWLSGAAFAQKTNSVDSLFDKAVEVYRKGQYHESLGRFEALDRSRPNHALTTASLLMQGKALYKMGETQRAKEAFLELIRDHPTSLYVDDAQYGLAQVLYRQNAVRDAVLTFMALLAHGGSRPLLDKAEKLASDMMDAHMEIFDLKGLLRDIPDEKGKAFVVLKMSRREIADRRFQSANEILVDFLKSHPNNAYAPLMEKLRKRSELLGKGTVKLGVILPLSGPLGEQGNQLLAGVRYAVRINNERKQLKFDLITRDSEGDMIRAIRAAQDVCRGEEVAAVIGDLESAVTEGVAAVAQENETPCIAPTAMEDGIVDIGPCVFQINGTVNERARALAQYAVTGLGLKRFALLYPIDGYGKLMRKAFVAEVTRLGGEVLAEKWYTERTEDYNSLMGGIREEGLRCMISDSLVEARGSKNTELQKPFIDHKAASMLDKRDYAVTSIDGLFLIADQKNVESILSQLQYHNIKTQLMGGSNWDDLAVLVGHRDVLDGIVYYSDFYADPYSPQFTAFRSGFKKAFGRNPEKMEAIGFDAASVLFEAMGDKAMPKSEIRDGLAGIRGFKGVRGPVSFENNRVNPAFHLLQFREGKVTIVR
jgi:branched-chain amino acid transport system substrate-binding protein